MIFFSKSVNIWQNYKQERGCLMHFVRLASTLLKDEESARDIDISQGSVATYAVCGGILVTTLLQIYSETFH